MYAKHGNLVDADASSAKASIQHLESRLEVIQGHAFYFWQMIQCTLLTKTNQKAAFLLVFVSRESHAVAGKPHERCHGKIWYLSKFIAASRGSPCDSTAFLFTSVALCLGLVTINFILIVNFWKIND